MIFCDLLFLSLFVAESIIRNVSIGREHYLTISRFCIIWVHSVHVVLFLALLFDCWPKKVNFILFFCMEFDFGGFNIVRLGNIRPISNMAILQGISQQKQHKNSLIR